MGRPRKTTAPQGVNRRLEEVRKAAGFESLHAFWQHLTSGDYHVSYEALRNYHFNRQPTLEYLAEVAKAFGYRLEWLVYGEEPKLTSEWVDSIRTAAVEEAARSAKKPRGRRYPVGDELEDPRAAEPVSVDLSLPPDQLARSVMSSFFPHFSVLAPWAQAACLEVARRYAEDMARWGRPSTEYDPFEVAAAAGDVALALSDMHEPLLTLVGDAASEKRDVYMVNACQTLLSAIPSAVERDVLEASRNARLDELASRGRARGDSP